MSDNGVEQGGTAMVDSLRWMRDQEAHMHRNRRITNWVVAIICSLTLLIVGITSANVASNLPGFRHNQQIILHNQFQILRNEQYIIARLCQLKPVCHLRGGMP